MTLAERQALKAKAQIDAVEATTRLAAQMLNLGLIVRRINVSESGALTVDVGGYEDPKAPVSPDKPRFRSYREMSESVPLPNQDRPRTSRDGS